jgi:hypothetical protein
VNGSSWLNHSRASPTDRLSKIKGIHDPMNLFRLNSNIEPATA